MKTKDVASHFGLNKDRFETFLRGSNYKSQIKENTFTSVMTIDDRADINSIVRDYKQYEENLAAKAARLRKEEDDKKSALASMLITSGFNFDGYTITKYSGYISGDDAVQIDRGTSGGIFSSATDVGAALMSSLVHIRRNSLAELKEAAYALDCNAVIGVDFDYLILDPQTANFGGGTTYLPYVFGVTANGNAVVIQKNE